MKYMDLNETICFCADVTAGDIKKSYDEGHTTVDAIGEATEAGTLCGGCQDRIAEMCIRDSIWITNKLKCIVYNALSERIRDRKSTRLNSSHVKRSRMPSSA